jgi:hypothetical protein
MQIYRLDLSTNPPTWTLVEIAGPSARHGHAMALMRQHAYLFGGYDGKNTLLSDLWVLNIPDARKGQDIHSMQWTQLLLDDSPLQGRTGHRLLVFGSNILLMGGRFDVSVTPDRTAHVLRTTNTDDCNASKWIAHPTFTLGALSEYQAVAAIGSIIYVFGGSVMGNVIETARPLMSAEALPWYDPANNDRQDCYRTMYTPQIGVCAGRALTVFSCGVSIQDVYSAYASREDSGGPYDLLITVGVNNNNDYITGPRWFQSEDECVQNVTAMCLSLGADAVKKPVLCTEDFLCASDSLYTTWSKNPGMHSYLHASCVCLCVHVCMHAHAFLLLVVRDTHAHTMADMCMRISYYKQ